MKDWKIMIPQSRYMLPTHSILDDAIAHIDTTVAELYEGFMEATS